MRTRAMFATLAVISLVLGVSGSAGPGAVIEPFDTFGGSWSSASAISPDGVVVGAAAAADDRANAFVADPAGGPPVNLGTLGGSWSSAYAVNDSGVVVGVSSVSDFIAHAFTTGESGELVDLGTLGGSWSAAYGINASGTIVGESTDSAGNLVAFVHRPETGMVALGTLGGSSSQAYGINADGVIVGESETADGQFRAFRLAGPAPEDLGTLGGSWSRATAINAAGQITGNASTAGAEQHAFRFEPGIGMVDLGTLGGTVSSGEAISTRGHVVGWSNGPAGDLHAFLWTPETGMVDLNTLVPLPAGVRLIAAYGINDAGQVAGYGTFDGRSLAFRLTLPDAGGPEDVTPPVVHAVTASPGSIWPPNHEMVTVSVSVHATDDSGAEPGCGISSVTSSEPDLSGEPDDRPGDIELTGAQTLRVRAERLGSGPGRTYTVAVTCADDAGNESAASTAVHVPHSAGEKVGVARAKM